MAWTGFNFRAATVANTFPGEGAGNVAFPTAGSSYVTANAPTYGYTGTAAPLTQNDSSAASAVPADGRLWGWHTASAGSVIARIDLPKGNYQLRGAFGTQSGGAIDVKIYDGLSSSGILLAEINPAVSAGSVADITTAQQTLANWAANQGVLNVTINNGFITIVKGAAANSVVRHFAYQPITTPLGPARLDTDETNTSIATTGDTTASNAAIANIPAVQGISAGMSVAGGVIPAGTTVAAVSNALSTTGTTTAGQNTITGLPSVIGIAVGDVVTGPNIPTVDASNNALTVSVTSVSPASGPVTSVTLNLGSGSTTSATGGALTFTGNNTKSLTLSSGSGVTAATGGALRFFWAPQLWEKSPAGKIIAPLTIPVGSAANIAIMMADGVTPHPNITTRVASGQVNPAMNGQLCLAYTAIPFSPGSATSHTFVIVQTDPSGSVTGSPFSTSLTLPVTLAPTKPIDGVSLLSRISTGAFLRRKKILDTMNATRWPGYKGQAFAAGNDVLVTSLAALFGTINGFATKAGNGAWFRIRLSAVAGSDFNTSLSLNTTSWNFFPEQGGGLLIEPDPLNPPMIRGAIFTGNRRGFHWRGLTFCGTCNPPYAVPNGTPGTLLRADSDPTKPLTVEIVWGNKFGMYHDPQYSPANQLSDTTSGLLMKGVWYNGAADQATVIGNDYFGTVNASLFTGVRSAESGWNKFRCIFDDAHDISTLAAGVQVSYTGAPAGDCDNYFYIHHNTCFAQIDNASANGYKGSTYQGTHSDFCQAISGAAYVEKAMWRVFEENVLVSNNANFNTAPGTNVRDFSARQFIINTATNLMYDCVIGNVVATSAARGIDQAAGDSYAEFNSLLGAGRMPPSASGGLVTSADQMFCYTNNYPGRRRSRKNISASFSPTALNGQSSEDDVIVNFASVKAAQAAGQLPAIAFSGGAKGFYADTADAAFTDRIIFDVPDSFSLTPAQQRKGLWAVAKPIVDAGALWLTARIAPGESDSLTATQAASLVAVTDTQPSGALPGPVSLRWNNAAGETGSQIGVDASLSVQ